MTPEEQKQVQDILNLRTKLLNERIAQQDEQLASLNAQLAGKEQELASLRTQLGEAQKLTASLQAEIDGLKSRPEPAPVMLPSPLPQPETPKPQKPSYLVSLLRQHFGLDSFMPGQEEIVEAILSGRDVFCSMPGHSGSSICFRLSALLMPGVTLVITDSEHDYPEIDSHSEALSASATPAKKRELFRKVKGGIVKVLYAALDLLSQDDTRASLGKCEVSFAVMLTSSLKGCTAFLESLSRKRIARGIFVHSTSPADRQEAYKYLRSPVRIVSGFIKPDASMKILRTDNRASALQDLLADKTGQHGVIYCSTPESVWRLREILRDYPNLDDYIEILPSRLHRQITRKDIRFVIHYDLPENLAAYSEEIAPAGLDGSKSECVILVSRKDLLAADKSIVKFCSAKKPKDYMLEYLGQEEKYSSQPEQPQPEELKAEDFSDFDFGTANEAQKEAITAANGPMLIIAGPGTGKTYTLVQRAVFLIQKKRVKPSSIMMATFTDKAAQELITRISEALSSRNILADTGSMYAGTFHVICSRILREYSEFTGLGKTFRILDEFGHANMIMQYFKRFSVIPGIEGVFRFPGKWRRSCELRDYISKLSEELTDPEELVRDPDPAASALGQAMQVHAKLLKERNCMSYSSLLVETYRLLRDNPEILESLQRKINYIMIDEYQDTNYVQEQLVFLIGAESRNICVVGDDDQSLYRFRGATVRNILEFPDKWGKSECKIVRLMLNYRSSPEILNFASRWMDSTDEFFSWENFRHAKKLEAFRPASKYPSVMRLAGIGDEEGWREKILSFINSLRDSGTLKDYSQIAFLFRSVRAEGVQKLAHFLEANSINVYSPRSNLFFTRMEIRFAVGCLISMFPSYLKDLESGSFRDNDAIDYYKGCLQVVARYISRPNFAGLKKHLLRRRRYHGSLKAGYTHYIYTDLLYELFAYEPFSHALSVRIDGGVKELRPSRNLARLVQVFRDYERSYGINNIKADNLPKQFEMMMNIYLRFRIDEGLDEYESDYESIPSGHVAFMTIHQAKGREFPVVFVDSLWAEPDPALRQDWNNELISSITEKHSRRPEFEPRESIKLFDFWRMYYVAFTRAQNMLVLTCNENAKTPSKYLEAAYNTLEDTDDIFAPSEVELDAPRDSGLRKTYSFTSHILTYETCPMQYKFFRELEFPMGLSQTTFLGKLVHTTIEDIHRAAINHEEHNITEPNIAEWFAANYEKLSRTDLAYLSEASRKTAFSQVMHYVHLQGNDWSGIAMAEAEVNLVRDEYILEGKIDLVRIRDGETEIIDFKSGTKPNMNISSDRERLENCRRQVNVYAYLAVHALGLKVARMKLYYTGEEWNVPEIVYPYDESRAEEVVKGFDAVVSKIQEIDFEHRTGDLEACGECVFRYWCSLENPAIPAELPYITSPDSVQDVIPSDEALIELYEK